MEPNMVEEMVETVSNEDTNEFKRVLEGLPLNVMLCYPISLIILYANETGQICKDITGASDLLVSLADGLNDEVKNLLPK